ncbi:MAG: DUF5721 family protein [Clostridiales bacterium]|jgi:hypothetical protein|nr:DUF5721 family protein [Clostridiales bacterium]
MQVFEAASDSIKSVMNQLLKGTAFDGFLVRGAEISVLMKIEISGILDKNYFPEAERGAINRNYVRWAEIKPFVFSLIRSGRTPSALKIVFSLPDEDAIALHDNASALFLNLLFEGRRLRFTTAVSQRSFSLDRSLDAVWDSYIKDFLIKNRWSVSTLG